jgi:hypothetical protein
MANMNFSHEDINKFVSELGGSCSDESRWTLNPEDSDGYILIILWSFSVEVSIYDNYSLRWDEHHWFTKSMWDASEEQVLFMRMQGAHVEDTLTKSDFIKTLERFKP